MNGTGGDYNNYIQQKIDTSFEGEWALFINRNVHLVGVTDTAKIFTLSDSTRLGTLIFSSANSLEIGIRPAFRIDSGNRPVMDSVGNDQFTGKDDAGNKYRFFRIRSERQKLRLSNK